MTIYKPRRESWSRSFSHSPQKEPTKPTPSSHPSGLQDSEIIHFHCSTVKEKGKRECRAKSDPLSRDIRMATTPHQELRLLMQPTLGWFHRWPHPFLFPARYGRDVTRRKTSILHSLPWVIKTRASGQWRRQSASTTGISTNPIPGWSGVGTREERPKIAEIWALQIE